MHYNFMRLAKALIAADQVVDLARRYLSIRRRQRVVKRALRLRTERVDDRLAGCDHRLAILRRYLESRLLQTCLTPRFSAVVAKEAALPMLAAGDEPLIVAFHPDRGLVLNSQPIPTAWGRGGGLAVIRRGDLLHLLSLARYGICFQAFTGCWVGWVDSTPSGAPKGFQQKPIRFAYHAQP